MFDTEALRRGIEHRDADALLALYAPDAEYLVVDRDNPPSKPLSLRGRDAIGAYLRDVCGRDMTHRLTHVVADAEQAAFLQSCAYPDETRVLCAAVLELRDGRIVRQTGVQAWDA